MCRSRVVVHCFMALTLVGLTACQSCPCGDAAADQDSQRAAARTSASHPPIIHPIGVWSIGGTRHMLPATIKSVAVDGDILSLTVAYAGGGKHHDIGLLRGTGFLESSPPQLDLYLTHTSTDSGSQPTEESLRFDLASVKAAAKAAYPDIKTVVLRIHDSSNDDIFVPLPRYSF